MRGNIRGRKKKNINAKKMTFAILTLIFIALFIVFVAKIISNYNINNDLGNSNRVNNEKVIPEDITINFVAIGDIMCHKTNFKAAYNLETKTYDFSPVFTNVAKYITKADIAIRKLRNNFCRRSKRI